MPAAGAAEKPRGSSIEFSDSASSVSTNLNQLGRKADSLKQLEQDLFKPFKVFSPKSSLDGVSLPPPRVVTSPAIQNKRVKELIERRKNWIFMSPEDFAPGTTAAEIFKLPEYDESGQEKEKESKLDRFYRNMDRESGDEGENPDDEIFPLRKKKKPHEEFSSTDEEEEENAPLKALRDSEKSLKTMFDQGKGAQYARSAYYPQSFAGPVRVWQSEHGGLQRIFRSAKSAYGGIQAIARLKFASGFRTGLSQLVWVWQSAKCRHPAELIPGPYRQRPVRTDGRSNADQGGLRYGRAPGYGQSLATVHFVFSSFYAAGRTAQTGAVPAGVQSAATQVLDHCQRTMFTLVPASRRELGGTASNPSALANELSMCEL